MLSPFGHTAKVPFDSNNIDFYVLN